MSSVCSLLLILLFASVSLQAGAGGGGKRPFTVRDAIELNVLHEQRGREISVSPSGDRFFTVTSRGLVERNVREFRVEIYATEDIDEVRQTDVAVPLKPAQSVSLVSSSNRDAIKEARWDADGGSVSFLGAQGDETFQVYQYDLREERLRRLTSSPLDVVAFDHRGGTTIYAARTSSDAPDLDDVSALTITDESLPTLIFPEGMFDRREYATFLIRPELKEPRQVHGSKRVLPFIHEFAISPNGRHAAGLIPAEEFRERWRQYEPPANEGSNAGIEQRAFQFHLIDLETCEIRPLVATPASWVIWSRNQALAVWSDDGSKLLMTSIMAPLTDKEGGQRRLSVPTIAVQEFENGEPTRQSLLTFFDDLPQGEVLVDAEWDQKAGVFRLYTAGGRTPESYGDRAARKGYQVASEDGAWRVREGAAIEAGGAPVVSGEKLSVIEDANTPPAVWASDIETGEETKLRELNPQLSGIALSRVDAIEWKDASGKRWSGALILPKDRQSGERVPLVIELKFASLSKFKPDGPYTTAFATQALAAKGIAVLEVDAFDPETMHSKQEAPTQLDGMEAAIDHLDSQGLIDTKRIGVIGFSRTAYYVKYALTHTDFDFASAALSDGIDAGYVQYVVFGVNYYDGAAAEDKATLNGAHPYGKGLKLWMENAPGFNTHRVQAPLRIEAIGKSSALQEWEFFSALKMTGKPVEMNYIPHGTHVLVKPEERLASQQGNVDWFGFWLLGIESSVPVNSDQYSRWRMMRKTQCEQSKGDEGPWYCENDAARRSSGRH